MAASSAMLLTLPFRPSNFPHAPNLTRNCGCVFYHSFDSLRIKAEFVKPPHIKDLEDKMRSQLGTKVSIQARKNGQRGKIVIEFYSLDEFDRITEKIGIDRLEV